LFGTLAALSLTAFKVGALSYGGGFVIVPLMQADAVSVHHWMTSGQFLNAVALGQITPGPVTHTVAVVGYAAGGVAGGLLAAVVAFSPSFAFILLGARHFDRLRRSARVRAFLDGAGPAAIGAILGASIPLVQVPITPGKNITVIAEVIAMNHLLKYSGVDPAERFNERLMRQMRGKSELMQYLREDNE
jgi:chromate transporter